MYFLGSHCKSTLVIDAHQIHDLLDVEKYIQSWPLIPKEELYASSVQHPRHPNYRWLLNTRRVPMATPGTAAEHVGDIDTSASSHVGVATEHTTPSSAGVGMPDEPVWLCKSCTTALCRREPMMPFHALSNWSWGGRVHPAFQDLSIAMQMLQGIGRPLLRMIVLQHSEHEDDQERGLVGNTILLAQPTPKEVKLKLPPADDEVSDYFSVVFNTSTTSPMSRQDVGKQKAFTIDREHYLRCVAIRKQVCLTFAEVEVDEQDCRARWPEHGVPTSIIEAAVPMDTIDTFNPTSDGPATMRAPTCPLPAEDDCAEEGDDNDAVGTDCGDPEAGAPGHDHSGAATEHADASPLPRDLPAEYVIGVQEDSGDDVVNRMLAFQRQIELVQENAETLGRLEQRRQECTQTRSEDAVDAASRVAAQKATHMQTLVELSQIANRMGVDYQRTMEEAITSSEKETSTPNTLFMKAGKPLNMFAAPAWAASFVQFLYGDCAPNLERPQKVAMRELFNHLMCREELEYHLSSDREDPCIPGGCYRAPARSRWDTPEFAAIFADTVRKVSILQTTKAMFQRDGSKWKTDMELIANATVADFEKLQVILTRQSQHNIQDLTRLAHEHGLHPLFTALRYLTFQTGNIPLTQGYKASLRQLGFALNIYDGPLTVFLTTNFADTYSPITLMLINGAGEPLGTREVNLLENVPEMPALRVMHRALAKHPMIQAQLFLFLDDLVHSELLCMKAWCGRRKYTGTSVGYDFAQEDDFASTAEIGIALFPRSALKPLEAQGRGFAHGHEKVISVPQTRAARLKKLFAAAATERGEEELTEWCRRAREALLQAATTLQYDSAILSGEQLGVPLPPEPFTSQQQKRSKFDGQEEEAADNRPRRPLIPVTEPELNGHVKNELAKAIAEQRPPRHPYKEMPLTGAHQSMLPTYRLSSSFGRITVPDEHGNYQETATEHLSASGWLTCNAEYAVEETGEITDFCMPNGDIATEEQIREDSVAWATSHARDQRAGHVQNHDHDCTGTCVKYQKKKKDAAQLPERSGQKLKGAGVPKCRFRFFRYVLLMIDSVVKYVMRRGKDIVETAYISTGSEENDCGKAVVPRGQPFRSSTQDVLQTTVRCNADYQYQKRAVPEAVAAERDESTSSGAAATEPDVADTQQATFLQRLFYGCRKLPGKAGKRILITLATAMRAAHIADFYMTKYLSKAQEALGPTIQPLIAGLRRQEEAEKAPEASEMSLLQRARQRIRRLIFCANRTHWLSACELCVFLATGGSCVVTEPPVKAFSGKGVAMMHECKRLLNNETAGQGLLFAARSSGGHKDVPMNAFFLEQEKPDAPDETVEETAAEEGGDAIEPPRHEDEGDAGEHRANADEDIATEHVAEPCNEDLSGVAEHSQDAEADIATEHVVPSRTAKTLTFSKTFSPRDDWLHRGAELQDVDQYHYYRYFERVEMPRRGTAQGFQKTHGVFYLFDQHYPLSRNSVQVLRKHAHTVQNVGPQCLRSDVNQGEDNAIYKAFFFTCLHCTGADECANPLICSPALFPSVQAEGIPKRFAPAWKARRAEIEVLADRAALKHDMAKRIGVIHDTTAFKGTRIPRSADADGCMDAATEPAYEGRVQQILVTQIVSQRLPHMTCRERVLETLMLFADVPLPWHLDQAHLAEWQAHSAREILFNLDMSVEARNLAKKQALKHKNLLVEEDEDDFATTRAKLTVEDLGGAPLEEVEEAEENFSAKERVHVPHQRIFDVLVRKAERDMAGRPGRPRDQHKEMQRVAEVFGTELAEFAEPFPTAHRRNAALGTNLLEALAQQKEIAEKIRQQQSGAAEAPQEQQEAEAQVSLLTPEALVLLQSMPEEAHTMGPVAVAKHLVDGATLNDDQKAPVALIAHAMQTAWEKQGKPKGMRPHGAIVRMLMVGGGGCGKSRIVNLVLTSLFLTFWGPRGCAKMAPSNKAARGICGKTMHAASKLRGGSLKMFVLRTSQMVQSALAYLYVPCGAVIIDEVPQGAAALYHACSLRATYGRASAYDLEIADYAEASQSFGAMPVVVECGDELQLPPVPAQAGLFAEHTGVATEHMAGLQIFKQKDYVYRLSTMKRFTDEQQIAILTKMRQQGGSKLTSPEWKALRDTELTTLSATERRSRLRNTELWYQAAPTWATVSMAQPIRSRLSAQRSATTLYIMPAEDYVLNRPFNMSPEHIAEEILRVPNMNNTGRLPSIAMIHIGMEMRLTVTVEAPEAVVDSTCTVIGLDLEAEDASAAQEPAATRILRKLPKAVIVRLDDVKTEFLPPIPCALHAAGGAQRGCTVCDFQPGCIAIEPKGSLRPFQVDVIDAASEHVQYSINVQRRQVPLTIRTASTLHTLQGVTADPGLIFHWKFPRFMSAELRWLATYVALSRPRSLSQLHSVGMPDNLREIIEGGPPEGILTRFNQMFKEKEVLTHLMAEKIMRELGWPAS